MTIPNSSCSFTEKKERNPQLRQSQFTCFLSGWIICYIRKIKHFRDKNISNSTIISEQWPNLKNKRFSIEESKEFRIKIIWQGVYIKYKTLESFSINKYHTTTSYKIFCGKTKFISWLLRHISWPDHDASKYRGEKKNNL